MGLDSCSSSSYMDASLMEKLEITGKKTALSITTIESKLAPIDATIIENLEIYSTDGENKVEIPKIYAKERWPFNNEDSPNKEYVDKYPKLKYVPFKYINSKIGILIGMNMPDILKPLEIVETTRRGPYASRHELGWSLNGPVHGNQENKCFRTKLTEINDLDLKFEQCFGKDFEDNNEETQYSVDDEKWLQYVTENTEKLTSNHYQTKLPFKEENIIMPNNYRQVIGRLNSQKTKFERDKEYFEEYKCFMTTMRELDFVEQVPDDEINTAEGKCWFLTHHGVRHKQKGKLRIVFDCSLKYKGVSLNDKLRKGPDLTNTLLGVLLRFRLEKVAVSGDICKMFYMIKLPKYDTNFVRFLWFKDDNFLADPVQYRLKVHLFGATSSPAIANYALKRSVLDPVNIEPAVKNTVLDSFYVDDLMKSFVDEETAIHIMDKVQNTLAQSGFNLTSFASNSRAVLNSIPKEKLSKQLENVNIDWEDLPCERALGIKWNPNNDTIGYHVNLPEQPATKRGLLSTIFSIYDPLFIVSPLIIRAKRLFQITCDLKLDWDTPP